jgi:hypothetical protein
LINANNNQYENNYESKIKIGGVEDYQNSLMKKNIFERRKTA